MPSSMIFVGLVVTWLLILVPAVARHRQEVARPSVAALSGRVLMRSQRRAPEPVRDRERGRNVEIDVQDGLDPSPTVTTRRGNSVDGPSVPAPRGSTARRPEPAPDPEVFAEVGDPARAERSPRDPSPRFRPGRGGFDAAAAALAARARYAFRQRVVLAMLVAAVGTGLAAAVAVPVLWWVHGALDVLLLGYLGYLRRQVRLEETIRERRAARMTGRRRGAVDEVGLVDDRARPSTEPRPGRSRPSERRTHASDVSDTAGGGDVDDGDVDRGDVDGGDVDRGDVDRGDVDGGDLGRERPERVRGAGEPVEQAPTGSHRSTPDPVEGAPALPRLQPAPPPPLPAGTVLVEADDDDPALHELDGPVRPDYRRAVGE